MTWIVAFTMGALMPRTEHLPGVADTGLSQYVRNLRRDSTTELWLGVVLGSLVFVMTPLFTVGLPVPAFWLPRGLRDRHASKISHAKIYIVREAIFLVKTMGGLCWGADPEVRKALQLDPYPPDPGTWKVD